MTSYTAADCAGILFSGVHIHVSKMHGCDVTPCIRINLLSYEFQFRIGMGTMFLVVNYFLWTLLRAQVKTGDTYPCGSLHVLAVEGQRLHFECNTGRLDIAAAWCTCRISSATALVDGSRYSTLVQLTCCFHAAAQISPKPAKQLGNSSSVHPDPLRSLMHNSKIDASYKLGMLTDREGLTYCDICLHEPE
jgi:hypothetical protein